MSEIYDAASQTCEALADFINTRGRQLEAQGRSADEAFAILALALSHCSAATLSQRSKHAEAGHLGFALAVGLFAKQMLECGSVLFQPAPATAPDGRPLQ